MNGLQTLMMVRRVRRERLARYPRIRTAEDREAMRRMEGLMVAFFIAVVLVPLVLLFVDRLADLDYGQRAIAAVAEAVR